MKTLTVDNFLASLILDFQGREDGLTPSSPVLFNPMLNAMGGVDTSGDDEDPRIPLEFAGKSATGGKDAPWPQVLCGPEGLVGIQHKILRTTSREFSCGMWLEDRQNRLKIPSTVS